MHYIRFLKSPRLLLNSPPVLSAKVTVTTDLGESFLLTDIALFVELESEDGSNILGPGKGREYMWKGRSGMRSLEVSIPIPLSKSKGRGGGRMRMLVRPKEDKYNVDTLGILLTGNNNPNEDEGRVLAVRSMSLDNGQPVEGQNAGVGMAKRVLISGSKEIVVWEETGESIARHIWDAGLMLSSYIAAISPFNTPHPEYLHTLPELPTLGKILSLKDLNILELGAGCGIVGITLSKFLPSASQILLTDLPEASEILEHNLSPSILLPQNRTKITHQVLDWASPLQPDIKETDWDLIVVADCTYNPDVVPDLVSTLKSITQGNKRKHALILLAMKVRHESEMVFFDLMARNGFVIQEKAVLPLPVLAGEGEQIEIFGFMLRDAGD